MKTRLLVTVTLLLFVISLKSQNLYDFANAASIENEANSTDGWTQSSVSLTSDNTDSYDGLYSIRIVSNDGTNDSGRLRFDVIQGTSYTISIWAKRGAQGTTQVFKNWIGFSDFATQTVTSTTWTEYTFNITASITGRAQIRCYPTGIGGGVGDDLFIDAITITEASSDTEAPTAVTDLASSNTTLTATDLSWTASTDNVAVTDYEVFQDGVSIGFTGGATTFNVNDLSPNTNYAYTVFARDAIPNISAVSNTENVITLTDNEAPSAVTDLTASNTTETTTDLSWTASIDNVGVTDYEVFQDGVSIGFTAGTTTFNVTGLSLNTGYDFTVFARDAVPNISAVSNTENITTLSDTQAPSAIIDLVAVNTTMTTTDLTWSASTDNIAVTDYEVFQDGVSIGFTGGVTTFNITGLLPDTNYAFTVFARDAVPNISVVSNTANVTTLADTEAPSAISDLIASGTTGTTTNLSWTEPSDNVGVTDYEVFQGFTSLGLTGGITSFNVTGLLNFFGSGVVYGFTVYARDAAGNVSAISNLTVITTTFSADPPPPPDARIATGLNSSNISENSVLLSWTHASPNGEHVHDYEVLQDGVAIGVTGGLISFDVTGLNPATSYEFDIATKDALGNTIFLSDAAINVVTLSGPDIEAPSAISDLVASNTTETTTDLSWTASTDNVGVTDYEVFQDGVSLGFSGGATTFNVTGLSPDTGYNFTVFARDAIPNISEVSNTENVTTLGDTDAPSAITDLLASNITSTTIDLSWTASTDNVGVTDYEVFQDGISIGLTGGATTFNITGLVDNTNYVFTVFARDAVPNISAVSNTANVLTLEVTHYTVDNANLITVDWIARDLFADRNVGIGTTDTQGYRLAVAGNMIAEEIKVALQVNWPDFVFKNNYKLPSLKEVEEHINKFGHLINIPSAKEVQNFGGIQLGQMNVKLLQKIEELTLYTINQQKEIEQLKSENSLLKQDLLKRISALEQKLVEKK